MAMSASIAVSSATAKAGQTVNALMSVSNSGAADVLVMGIEPSTVPNGLTAQTCAVAQGRPALGGAFNQVVAAGGSATFGWALVFHAPTTSEGLAEPASLVYSVGATLYSNDGSVTEATPATVTVTNPVGL